MFQSSRFEKVVTPDTRARLLRALSNEAPLARHERHRGAVVAVQTALAALNAGYLRGAEIDGYFGSRTFAAVEAFQRDYGLIADGVVGRQVLTQLDTIFSPEASRPPMGVSIHVGVDRVDPAHYGGPLTLPSCVNDARAMQAIAEGLGYEALTMENEEATTANFTAFLRSAADSLFAGDALLVTFSGHGGQVPNTSEDDEPDLADETLCFHDRMLIDDELFALMGDLREGVRVHAVFDSCHSGTAFKQLVFGPFALSGTQRNDYAKGISDALADVAAAPLVGADGFAEAARPIRADALAKALDGDAPELVPAAAMPEEQAKGLGALFADLYESTSFGQSKALPGFGTYDANAPLYDAVKSVVGDKEQRELACTVTTLSACDDSQTTPAGNPLSLFTFNLTQSWAEAGMAGSYAQLHRAVLGRSRPDATPKINAYGSQGAEARSCERPFAF